MSQDPLRTLWDVVLIACLLVALAGLGRWAWHVLTDSREPLWCVHAHEHAVSLWPSDDGEFVVVDGPRKFIVRRRQLERTPEGRALLRAHEPHRAAPRPASE